jgi:tripeptidyl-peptidase-2
LTGRSLRLGASRRNPSNEWRLGVKAAFDGLFPGPAIERLKEHRAKARDQAAKCELAELEARAPSANNDDEWQARVSVLQRLQKDDVDLGPIYDCVVYHDGSVWRALVDTSESGAMADLPAMTDFRLERQHRRFSDLDMVSFSVNIYNNGDVLSLVATAGAHGTHVAGIVGGYYPQQPELNGIAPGCQMVSIKIGDSRLGSMETGTGLLRGLLAAKRAGAHVINMSYGEATARCRDGRFVQALEDLVFKHNVIFVSSAGNNGPALSTTGAPGAQSHASIGVGAFVSSEMMKAEYSTREELPAILYTWSSRGPSLDGRVGVSIVAPGGAIAPVPQFCLSRSQLMNGTSMSSPNACGGVALLLSACLHDNVKYTSSTVRHCLENSARGRVPALEHPLGQGQGVLNVPGAMALLRRLPESMAQYRIDVTLTTSLVGGAGSGDARGIYLRSAASTAQPHVATVKAKIEYGEAVSNDVRVALELRLNLTCAAPWVQAPGHVLLTSEKAFDVRVDATQLPRDQVHHTELLAIDTARPELGPVFRVPITVIRPRLLDEAEGPESASYQLSYPRLAFTAGHIERRFVRVPDGALHATLTLTADADLTTRRFYVHCVQLLSQKAFTADEFKKYVALEPLASKSFKFAVAAGCTLEVCVAQFWSSLGERAHLSLTLEFDGVECGGVPRLAFAAGERHARLELRSPLRASSLKVAGSVTHVRRCLAPVKDASQFALVDARDRYFDGTPSRALVLNYFLELSADAHVTVHVPLVSELLYESLFEGQFWQVYNEQGAVVHFGDFRPEAKKLKKGKYGIVVLLRCGDRKLLDTMAKRPIYVDLKLSSSIALSFHNSPLGALESPSAGKALTTFTMNKGSRRAVYVSAPLPSGGSWASPIVVGDQLVGKFSLYDEGPDYELICVATPTPAKSEAFKLPTVRAVAVSGAAPEPAAAASSAPANGAAASPAAAPIPASKREAELYAEHVRAAGVSYLTKLLPKCEARTVDVAPIRDDFEKVLNELIAQHPKHLPALLVRLRFNVAQGVSVEAIVEQIVEAADTESLIKYFGQRHESESGNGDEKAGTDEKERRAAVREALAALVLWHAGEVSQSTDASVAAAPFAVLSKEAVERVVAARQRLAAWTSLRGDKDRDFLHAEVAHLVATGRAGTAAKLAEKHADGDDAAALLLRRCLVALGWQAWEEKLRIAYNQSRPKTSATML